MSFLQGQTGVRRGYWRSYVVENGHKTIKGPTLFPFTNDFCLHQNANETLQKSSFHEISHTASKRSHMSKTAVKKSQQTNEFPNSEKKRKMTPPNYLTLTGWEVRTGKRLYPRFWARPNPAWESRYPDGLQRTPLSGRGLFYLWQFLAW